MSGEPQTSDWIIVEETKDSIGAVPLVSPEIAYIVLYNAWETVGKKGQNE